MYIYITVYIYVEKKSRFQEISVMVIVHISEPAMIIPAQNLISYSFISHKSLKKFRKFDRRKKKY